MRDIDNSFGKVRRVSTLGTFGCCCKCLDSSVSSLKMTYAGFTATTDPNYTELISPNNTYTVDGAGPESWTYGPGQIVLGIYNNGIDPPQNVTLTPAAACLPIYGDYYPAGADASLGYNYTPSPLGTPMAAIGSDFFYGPGTVTIVEA